MSFDLFISRFQDGESVPFRLSVLAQAIAPFVAEMTPDCFELRFSEHDGCTIFVETAAEEIDGFNVNRPCLDDRLYDALLAVLKVPGLVLVMSGESPPLIGHPETAGHLPPDMVKELGMPVLLQSASEILQRIEQA